MNILAYHHRQSNCRDKSGFLSAYRAVWSTCQAHTLRQCNYLRSHGWFSHGEAKFFRPCGIDFAAYDLASVKIMRGLTITAITDAQWVRGMNPTAAQLAASITL